MIEYKRVFTADHEAIRAKIRDHLHSIDHLQHMIDFTEDIKEYEFRKKREKFIEDFCERNCGKKKRKKLEDKK